jgi:hypothetical protein
VAAERSPGEHLAETKNRPRIRDRLVRRRGTTRYLADFIAVRRQRVQASTFTAVPFRIVVNGWRLG